MIQTVIFNNYFFYHSVSFVLLWMKNYLSDFEQYRFLKSYYGGNKND